MSVGIRCDSGKRLELGRPQALASELSKVGAVVIELLDAIVTLVGNVNVTTSIHCDGERELNGPFPVPWPPNWAR